MYMNKILITGICGYIISGLFLYNELSKGRDFDEALDQRSLLWIISTLIFIFGVYWQIKFKKK